MRVFGRNKVAWEKQHQRIVAWLKAHRSLWEGEEALPAVELARAIRAKGFYSAKTSLCDIKIDRLLELAKV